MPSPPSDDPAVKKSLSFPKSLFDKMKQRAKALGYKQLSQYLQHLARNDTQLAAPSLPRIAEEPTRVYNETLSPKQVAAAGKKPRRRKKTKYSDSAK